MNLAVREYNSANRWRSASWCVVDLDHPLGAPPIRRINPGEANHVVAGPFPTRAEADAAVAVRTAGPYP